MVTCFVLTVTFVTPLMMFVAMYTWSWSNNSMGALQGTLFASYFGRRHAGAIRSVSLTANMLFASAAGPLAGYVSDNTGSFNAIWWPMIGVLCLAAFLMVTSKPPRVRAEAHYS
jgi:predicted MFS family arabinose efflux permease